MLPLSGIQTSIYNALVPALSPVPVLDEAGPNQPFPYLTIGETISVKSDTLREQAVDAEITIHVWSRQPGAQETQSLMAIAKDALHDQRLPASGFQWVTTTWIYGQTVKDVDGITRHGILRFRVLTFQAAAAAPPPPPPPQLSGTVDTTGGMAVVWHSGDKFTAEVVGKTITIAGADYGIFQFISDVQVLVDPTPPEASGADYVILL